MPRASHKKSPALATSLAEKHKILSAKYRKDFVACRGPIHQHEKDQCSQLASIRILLDEMEHRQINGLSFDYKEYQKTLTIAMQLTARLFGTGGPSSSKAKADAEVADPWEGVAS